MDKSDPNKIRSRLIGHNRTNGAVCSKRLAIVHIIHY